MRRFSQARERDLILWNFSRQLVEGLKKTAHRRYSENEN